MKQRGQKSAAADSVVSLDIQTRPRPPECLNGDEKALWNDIVASRAPDFFDTVGQKLLTELCRVQSQVDQLAAPIAEFRPEWLNSEAGIKRYKDLSVMREKAQARLIQLATKMRLTQQSRYIPHGAKARGKKETGPKPWEVSQ